jgi:hypothetical protein
VRACAAYLEKVHFASAEFIWGGERKLYAPSRQRRLFKLCALQAIAPKVRIAMLVSDR